MLTRTGEAFSWGNNDFGQCGTQGPKEVAWAPHRVNFDQYYQANVR